MSKKTSNSQIEARIKDAFSHITPNHPSPVLSACQTSTKKGHIIMFTQKKKTSIVARIAGVAAALALLCGIGLFAYQSTNAVENTISLDVNPSVEISVNRNEKVLRVTPLNEDGQIILGDMDFKGSNLEITVNALIGSMVRNGYINELSNSVLLSVNGKNQTKNDKIREKLVTEINEILKTDSFEGSVLSQVVDKVDDELKALAEQYNISVGKAKLIRQITLQNTQYTFEELVELTINELNLLTESGSTRLEDVELNGTASDKKYIGKDAAMTIAITDAGIVAENITKYDCELDFEKGLMVYEIEIDCDDYEYDYVINAITGEIIRQEKELPRKHQTPDGEQSEGSCTETHITSQEALTKAMEHAGLAIDTSLSDYECELGRKRGVCVYNIEFDLDGYEYEYMINATTGDIVKYEKEGQKERPEHTDKEEAMTKPHWQGDKQPNDEDQKEDDRHEQTPPHKDEAMTKLEWQDNHAPAERETWAPAGEQTPPENDNDRPQKPESQPQQNAQEAETDMTNYPNGSLRPLV